MSDNVVTVTIPADSRFVALARVTTASLAAELDFGVDAIDDLRVGADELVAHLIEWSQDHGGDHVELRFRLGASSIEIEGQAAGGETGNEDGSAVLDDLTRQILAAVVDDYDIDAGRGRISKSRSGG